MHRSRTETSEAERAPRGAEEQQALILGSLPVAVYTADLRGRFAGPRFVSESLAQAIGFPAASFVDDPELWTARIHPADLRQVLKSIAAIAERGKLSLEYRWRCADGSERTFLDQAVLIRDKAGQPQEIRGTCLEVTHRRQLEQQLFQSQKMEALGQLMGGIAHDFNNMLSVIIWNLDSVSRALRGSGTVYDRVQMAQNGALTCAELIRQLLTFARHRPHQAKVIDLATLVPRAAKMLVSVLGETIKVEVNVARDIWPILADPAQVESALLNLAINSRDAMPEGGNLVIECRNVEHDSGDLDPVPSAYVRLSVRDNGTGMPQAVVDRAFEPFFTTKDSGHGSGLGLSMVYGFAKQCGGHAKLESRPDEGTTVKLYLPRCPADVTHIALPESESAPVDKSHPILVVEDDPNVRAVTVARLQEVGYKVCEADGAAAALRLLTSDTSVDLLFTDVVMPGGMNGIDLARRALELRPSLKVLFTSGYASTFPATGDVPAELLQKPYSDDDLFRALNRAFAGGSGGEQPKSASTRAR